MRRLTLALLALALWPAAGSAEHARIDLRLSRLDRETGRTLEEASAAADRDPPAGGYNPRPLLKARVNDPLVLQFVFTNTYPHGENKGVTVRYFVVREAKPGQKTLPDLSAGTVTEGQFLMTFKPQCRVGARVAFTVKEPGVYLLRVQSADTDSDHEHFSAIDLKVE
jgi:hypothetical protein